MRFGFHHHGCHPRARFAMRHGWRGGGGSDEFGWGRGRDDDMGGRGGRGGRRGRLFDGGELRLVLLSLIGEEPRHGYDLIRAIEERSGGAYAPSPGVVYPTLTMLGDMEQIVEAPSEGNRKVFTITDAGRAALEERAEEVAALLERLGEIARLRARTDGGPIRRAFMNLGTAVRTAAGQGERDIAHDIAAILDEAARKIERL